MPQLGLGVWRTPEGDQTVTAVSAALEAGYRAIDTAALYENENSVGQAVRSSGIPRENIFITTKVWNTEQGYDKTIAAFHKSLELLSMDYVDLYLVHWPVQGKYKETYRALEHLYEQGKIRAIGVSNFNIHHLEDLMGECRIKPMVNQVELHPLLAQKKLLAFCRKEGIQLESWRPLMNGNLDLPLLAELAAKYGKTPAQIALRWLLQRDGITSPIFGASTLKQFADNMGASGWTMPEETWNRLNEASALPSEYPNRFIEKFARSFGKK